jgi:hypothetical protein
VLTPGVVLGEQSGPGAIEHLETRATRDSRGRFFLKANYPTSIAIYSPAGRYLRSLGREGGGPGEFRGIGAISTLPNDSLIVFDWGLSRYTLYTADLALVTSGPLPLTPELSSIALRSGRFVFNSNLLTPNEVGLPLHLVNRQGALERSFGSMTGVYRPDVPYLMARVVTESRAGGVWSAMLPTYQIEHINPNTGVVDRVIRRDVRWFPPGLKPLAPGEDAVGEPTPLLFDIREDRRGYLWTLIAVPDSGWRAVTKSASGGEKHGTVLNEQGYYDSVIEVIDLARGALIASVRVPQHLKQFVGDDLVGGVIEQPDGTPRFQTWQMRLKLP